MLDIIYAAIRINKTNLKAVMWCIIAGAVISFVAVFFRKTVSGSLVRLLLEKGAVGAENAKTLAQLGIDESFSGLQTLKNATVGKIVTTVSEEGSETTYYISDEMKKRAEEQFGLKGNEIWFLIFGSLAFIALGAIITIVL